MHRKRYLVLVVILVLGMVAFAIATLSWYFYTPFPGGTTAEVVAAKVTCTAASPASCNVTMLNTGTEDRRTVACAIIVSGSAVLGINGGEASTNIPAGSMVSAMCSIKTSGGTPASEVTGYFALSNGKKVDFAGSWS